MLTETARFRGILEDSHETMRISPFANFLEQGIDFASIAFDPNLSPESRSSEDRLFSATRIWLERHVDPEKIEAEEKVPSEYLEGLRGLGCFRARIPVEYGGMGLSQSGFVRLLELIGSRSEVLALIVSVQQLGVIQSLLSARELDAARAMADQEAAEALRRRYLPWLARDALGAFCLTTAEAGSDPSRLETFARSSEDAQTFLLSGTWSRGGKLFTTLGTIADCYLMLAVVLFPGEDPETIDRRGRITAFLVDRKTQGISTRPLKFCGWRGLPNAAIQLEDVRVERSAMVGTIGDGLKIAFKNLASGRINIAAICLGMMKQLEQGARWWGLKRVQGGKPIGEHALNRQALLRMAASIYAVESYTRFVATLADSPGSDVRLEAAMLKLFSAEALIRTADDALQIRGGRGYETFASQSSRGETALPVERLYRSARMMRIGEGGSNVLLLYVIRCLLDKRIGDYRSLAQRGDSTLASWRRVVGFGFGILSSFFGRKKLPAGLSGNPLRGHLLYVERTRIRLLRRIYREMLGEGLDYLGTRLRSVFRAGKSPGDLLPPEESFENRQVLLGHFAWIAVYLSLMTVVCVRATRDEDESARELAELFCTLAREEVAIHFLQIAGSGKRLERQMGLWTGKLLSGDYAAHREMGTVPLDLP
ncbi:MAG: acyl-CoA dehydrogenase family protein [Gammaproteobacteria bacterium]